jgi:hypothetical protein
VLRKSFIVSLLLTLFLIFSSCNIITGELDSTSFGEENPSLVLMLHAVPAQVTTTILYNDIPALSEYHNVAIPPRTAPEEDKIEWWTSFQNVILWGYPFPVFSEVWGFDSVDISGMLTYWGEGPVTILSGNLDTEAFRTKLISYGYEESTYLGLSIFSGIPESKAVLNVDILPRAFGIINGAGPENEPYNLIIMSEAGDNDVEFGRRLVEDAFYAYRQKVSLADETNSLARLAEAAGRAGAVYATVDNRFMYVMAQVTEEQFEEMKTAAGPGILDPYRAVAMTYRRESGRVVFDFILDYKTSAEAVSGVPVLRERLKQGRSYLYEKQLSKIWTIEDVSTHGSLLRAKVRPIDATLSYDFLFIGMVYAVDSWFLYPSP